METSTEYMSSIAPRISSPLRTSPARRRSSRCRRASPIASAMPPRYGASSTPQSSGVGSCSPAITARVIRASAYSFSASWSIRIPHVGVCRQRRDALVDRGASPRVSRSASSRSPRWRARIAFAQQRMRGARPEARSRAAFLSSTGRECPGQIVEAHGRRSGPAPRVVGRRGARRRERCPRRRIHPCRHRSDEPCDFLPRPRTGGRRGPVDGPTRARAPCRTRGLVRMGSLPRALIHRRSQT